MNNRIWNAGKPVTFLLDTQWNEYIMHATPSPEASKAGMLAGNPTYPKGWTIVKKTLTESLSLRPAPNNSTAPVKAGGMMPFGDFACGYAMVQDSAGNAFHRYFTATTDAPPDLRLFLFGIPPTLFKPIGFTLLAVVVALLGIYVVHKVTPIPFISTIITCTSCSTVPPRPVKKHE